MLDAHRIAELRSLAAHREIADRLADNPALVARARARVEGWLETGQVHPEYARAWLELLALPLKELQSALVADDERARAMRQCTPFAGALGARERWQLWRRVKQELARSAR